MENIILDERQSDSKKQNLVKFNGFIKDGTEDNYYIFFKISINLYYLSKYIEEKFNFGCFFEEEYYFINLKWVQDFKEKFDYNQLQKFFEEKCDLEDLKKNLDNEKYIKKLYHDYYSIFNKKKISKSEIEEIKIIRNKGCRPRDYSSKCYKNFAIINKRTIEEMKKNRFHFDDEPKEDIYLGKNQFIIPLGKKRLECVLCKDFDEFTDEFLIDFINPKYEGNIKNLIFKLGLIEFFNINNIDRDNYKDQYIYERANGEKDKSPIATIICLNSEKKKKIKDSLNITISMNFAIK